MSTSYLEHPSCLPSFINVPATEVNPKLDRKGPTQMWWSTVPYLCVTAVNLIVASFMLLGVHYQRCL